jgi:hypothetical protein
MHCVEYNAKGQSKSSSVGQRLKVRNNSLLQILPYVVSAQTALEISQASDA